MACKSRDKIFELVVLKPQPPKSSPENKPKDSECGASKDLEEPTTQSQDDTKPLSDTTQSQDDTKPLSDSRSYQGLVKHTLLQEDSYTLVKNQSLQLKDSNTSASSNLKWDTMEYVKHNELTKIQEDPEPSKDGSIYNSSANHKHVEEKGHSQVKRPSSVSELSFKDITESKFSSCCKWRTSIFIGMVIMSAALAIIILAIILIATLYKMAIDAQRADSDKQYLELIRELSKINKAVLQINHTLSTTRENVESLKTDTSHLYQLHNSLSVQASENFQVNGELIAAANSSIQYLKNLTSLLELEMTKNVNVFNASTTRLANDISNLTMQITQANSTIARNAQIISVSQNRVTNLNSSLKEEIRQINGSLGVSMRRLQAIQLSSSQTMRRISEFSHHYLLADCNTTINTQSREVERNSEIQISVSSTTVSTCVCVYACICMFVCLVSIT